MKVFICHASAGYGHQRAAEVIARTFRERGHATGDVTVIDSLALMPFGLGKCYRSIYYYSIKYSPNLWGWLYKKSDLPPLYKILRPIRRFMNRLAGKKLMRRIKREKPDVLISTHFYPPNLFGEAKRKGTLQAEIVTVVTDFHPHLFWINEGTGLYWIMSEEGGRALEQCGVPKQKIIIGGIPVDARFRPSGRKKEILKKWGFSPDRFTVLITSGGFGFGHQAAILNALNDFADRIQCFVVCGRNAAAQKSLSGMKFDVPVKIFGFVDFMADLMEASDLLIAKPGGATTAESLAKGVPMVVLEPIPGQETQNARLLRDRNASFFIERPEQIGLILKALLENPELMKEKRRAIDSLAKPYAADELVTHILSSKGFNG